MVMSKKPQPTPNTHLGDVHWCIDSFFGSLQFVCQGMLSEKRAEYEKHFLNTKRHCADYLREFFDEIELENGCLCLNLSMSDSEMYPLALIETNLPYGEEISDQTFLNLIDDFVEYVRGLPLTDPDKREGALWTDEDIERGYCAEANERHREAMRTIGEAIRKSEKEE
jgi:hypothetical protein